MSETQNEACAPAQGDKSFHFQPEEPNGRPHPLLLHTPGAPLGSDTGTELLDYRALRRIMGEVVYFFEKGSEEELLSATSCMERSWIPVMHFGKAMRNACPQNTTAGILDLLCSFLPCPQNPERRKMCHCSQTSIFPVIFQKALLRYSVSGSGLDDIYTRFLFPVHQSLSFHFKYAKSVGTVYL